MLDLSLAPPPIHRLVAWLHSEGCSIVSEQAAGRNDQFAEFRCASRIIGPTADRGEWSITVATAAMTDRFHPDEWEAFLDGFELAGELSDLDHQVDFIVGRWQTAIRKANQEPSAESDLRLIGQGYVHRRLGLKPPGDT